MPRSRVVHRAASFATALGVATLLGIAGPASASAAPELASAMPEPASAAPEVPTTSTETSDEGLTLSFGAIEIGAICGAFLYGTAVVYVLRSVVRDQREGVTYDAVAF